jgi:hypothetical protein
MPRGISRQATRNVRSILSFVGIYKIPNNYEDGESISQIPSASTSQPANQAVARGCVGNLIRGPVGWIRAPEVFDSFDWALSIGSG